MTVRNYTFIYLESARCQQCLTFFPYYLRNLREKPHAGFSSHCSGRREIGGESNIHSVGAVFGNYVC